MYKVTDFTKMPFRETFESAIPFKQKEFDDVWNTLEKIQVKPL